MSNINIKYLTIIAVVLVVIFLYWGSGTMMNGDRTGMMHEDSGMFRNNWEWFASISIIAFAVFTGWLYIHKKKGLNKGDNNDRN